MFVLLDTLDIEMVMRDKPLRFNSIRELANEANSRVEKYKAEGKRCRCIASGPYGCGFYQIEEY